MIFEPALPFSIMIFEPALTDPLLAKAKLISDSGSIPVITHSRGRKTCCGPAVEREEWEYVRETTLQTPRSVKKEEEEMLQVPEQRFLPCSLWWRPWWGRLSACSPCRSTVEQICSGSPDCPEDPTPEQMYAVRGTSC